MPSIAIENKLGYKVQLFISCRNLKNLDGIGQGYSDPICFIYQRSDSTPQAAWVQIGQTEEILNNLNPDFQKSFLISYFFEKHQPLRFEVMDGDNKSGKYELIGAAEVTLGAIMGSKRQTCTIELQHNSRKGS
jgi:hypothetical protein